MTKTKKRVLIVVLAVISLLCAAIGLSALLGLFDGGLNQPQLITFAANGPVKTHEWWHTDSEGENRPIELTDTYVTEHEGKLEVGVNAASAKHYYLNADVELSEYNITIEGGYAELCLNGYLLKGAASADGGVITVGKDGNLSLFDCPSGRTHLCNKNDGTHLYEFITEGDAEYELLGGVITGGSNNGLAVLAGGECTMYNGTIAGNKSASEGGGVNAAGAFTLDNGAIAGNAADLGGGVYVTGTFTFDGGTIKDNTAENRGGGILVKDSATVGMGEHAIITENSVTEGGTGNGGGGVALDGAGATFNMNGGEISYNNAADAAGVYVYGATSGTAARFNMYGGAISYNESSNSAGGAYVEHGTLTMSNEKKTTPVISDNTAKGNYGGGVRVENDGKIVIDGGEIKNNKTMSADGGGVALRAGGTGELKNGTISGNIAHNRGGGVYVYSNSSFTMSGGLITGNTSQDGSGVCVMRGCTLNVSGAAKVYGNNKHDGSEENYFKGDVNNIQIADGSLITVTGALTQGKDNAKLGVHRTGTYQTEAYTTGYSSTNSGVAPDKFFFSDADNKSAQFADSANKSGEVVFVSSHIHNGDDFGSALTANTTVLVTDSTDYFLAGPVNLASTLTISGEDVVVTLCLGGYTLTGTGTGAVIEVKDGAELIIDDCKDGGKIVRQNTTTKDTVIYVENASLTLNYGTITGGTGRTMEVDTSTSPSIAVAKKSLNVGGGVLVNGGSVTMNNGKITGNSAVAYGGGVYMMGADSEFLLKGGSISHNEVSPTASIQGGAGIVIASATLTMEGGSIDNNTATAHEGGGVLAMVGAQFNMSGGTIADNDSRWGGAAYVCFGSRFVMDGGSLHDNYVTAQGGALEISGSEFELNNGTILNNTADGHSGALWITQRSEFTMNGGTIANNTAKGTYGGGVSLDSASTFTMTDGVISGNKAAQHGGGVYIKDSTCTFDMQGGTVINNTANTSNGNYRGGGVYNLGTFTMSGEAAILNNQVLEYTSNTQGAVGGGVYSEGAFTMDGGKISGNQVFGAYGLGGGVELNGATFTMNKGEISGNVAGNSGGGIMVGTGSTFIMNGGTISRNVALAQADTNTWSSGTAYSGGGGGVYYGGTFTMTDGTIKENTANRGAGVFGAKYQSSSAATATITGGKIINNTAVKLPGGTLGNGGGVMAYNGGILSISGTALISGNYTESQGGGVYFASTAALTISGGTISDNKAESAGGGVMAYNTANFTISGGTISGNTSGSSGGGVAIGTNAKLTISGGEFIGNKGVLGGGVANGGETSTLTITDGTFTGNEATRMGGAVHTSSPAMTISGGVYTGNRAAEGGGGVYFFNGVNVLNLSGTVQITGNTLLDGKTMNNVELPANKVLTFNGALKTGTKIGLTLDPERTETKLTSGYADYNGSTLPGEFFFMDDNNQGNLTLGGGEVVLDTESAGQHMHGLTEYDGEPLTMEDVAAVKGVLEAGSYLLTEDITTNLIIKGVDVELCLNGYTLSVEKGSAISVEGGKLTLHDCRGGAITGGTGTKVGTISETTYGGGIYVGINGALAMDSGYISGNIADIGGGIYVTSSASLVLSGSAKVYANEANLGGGVYVDGGVFEMRDGAAIASNSAKDAGAGLYVAGAIASLNGGAITDNKAGGDGAGVYVDGGSVTAKSFKITNNTAGGSGAGVYLDGGAFDAHNITITSNTAGVNGAGVYVDGDLSLNGKSGAPEITGNTVGGSANNVYLASGKQIKVTGALMGEGKVGVALEDGIGIFTAGLATNGGNYKFFSADLVGIEVSDAKGEAQIHVQHTHAVGNKTVIFAMPLSGSMAGTTLQNANYVLTDDVTLTSGELTVPAGATVYLCLNGYTLTGAAYNVITISGGNLILCDCSQGETGNITHTANVIGRGVAVEGGSFTMYGGNISGHHVGYCGGGVVVNSGGTFTMNGGTISDNIATNGSDDATNNGGGVYLESNSTFILNDGKILNNKADQGAGVYLKNSTFTMNGGLIDGNRTNAMISGKNNGGGVSAWEKSTVEIYGGTISNNQAESGGGILTDGSTGSSTFTLYDGLITNNSASFGGGVQMANSKGYMKGGTVSENETTRSAAGGGGVRVCGSVGEFHLSGGKIINNKAAALYGAGIYFQDNVTFTLSNDDGVVELWGNTVGGVENNVRLYREAKINVVGELVGGAKFGVGIEYNSGLGTFTTGLKDNGGNWNYFFADDKSKSIADDNGEAKIISVTTHTHKAGDKTVTFTSQQTGTKAGFALDNEVGYYLTGNLTISSGTITVPKDVTAYLCLNGYTLTAAVRQNAITVNGGTLILCDCSAGKTGKITRTNAADGRGVQVVDNGQFTMYGGTITGHGAANSNGGGVSVENSTFYMYGGTISNNYAVGMGGGVYLRFASTFVMDGTMPTISGNYISGSNYGGAGVAVDGGTFIMRRGLITENYSSTANVTGGGVRVAGGTEGASSFEMYGGEISNNRMNGVHGGGVFVGTEGEFTLHSGKIFGNTAANAGGGMYNLGIVTMNGGELFDNEASQGSGVYTAQGGTFNLNGGKIYNNKATNEHGGVYVNNSTFNLGSTYGMPEIYGNTANGATMNMYVGSGRTITVKGALEGQNKIGVTLAAGSGTFTKGLAANGGNYGYFFSDDTNKSVTADDNGEACIPATEGDVVGSENHHEIGVTSSTTALENGKHYYLTGHVTLTGEISVAAGVTATLCLNGFSITGATGKYDVTVAAGGTLTLCDCKGGGKLTHPANVVWRAVSVGGTFIMEGGEISGNSSSSGAGLMVGSSGHFIMKGGKITNNTIASGGNWGGGVYMAGGTFTMEGGEISGNTATQNGGGVYMTAGAELIMNGGKIIGNTAGTYGGGVYADEGSKITINDGEISDNTADSAAGGVYVKGGEFTMTDGLITRNKSAHNTGGVYIVSATGRMTGGTISDNTAAGQDSYGRGGGLYLVSGSEFIMEGGYITGNTAGTYGGGVLVYDEPGTTSTFTMIGGEISGNTANTAGGGIYVEGASTKVILSGGIITGNKSPLGGGVYVADGSEIELGGVVTIKGNTVNSSTSNLYLEGAETKITVTGELEGEALIGIELERGTGVFTIGLADNGDYKYFFADHGASKEVVDSDGEAELKEKDPPHVHADGTKFTDELADGAEVTDGGIYLEDGGHYYLAHNVTIGGEAIVVDDGVTAYLCLNGYTLTGANNNNVIRITGGTLYLCDCGTTGKVTHAEGANGRGVFISGGALNMSGGSITGNKLTSNNVSNRGGGVYMSGGTFTMTGGTIANNNTVEYGGGVYIAGGTFNMNGGEMYLNTADLNSGAGVYQAGGRFNMFGGEITRHTAEKGAGVYLASGNFAMGGTNGEMPVIYNNKAAVEGGSGLGGGVYMAGGIFTMKSGEVMDNSATLGAGVYLGASGANFQMDGGFITNNVASTSGGGVYIENGRFILTGGMVASNQAKGTADTNGGGGVYMVTGTFSFQGGEIWKNDTAAQGGGVYVAGGAFTMDGRAAQATPVISENKSHGLASAYGGGGVAVMGGTFTMWNGKITENVADDDGGAMVVKNATAVMHGGEISYNVSYTPDSGGGAAMLSQGSEFTVNGGEIKYNKTLSSNGTSGAVYNHAGTFTVNGGEIFGNEAYYTGGVRNYGTFNMNGGKITGNKAFGSGSGGVYLLQGTFNLNTTYGMPEINGNTKNGAPDNLLIDANNLKINVQGKLEGEKKIGVHLNYTNNIGTFTSGLKDHGGNWGYFFEDFDGTVADAAGEAQVTVAGHHRHDSPIANYGTVLTNNVHYYMADDVKLNSYLSMSGGANVYLCLNGHSLIGSNGATTIQISGGTLGLYDCQGDGKITRDDGETGVGLGMTAGTVNMYGGNIVGNTGTNSTGGGVYMKGTSIWFNMYGGTIANNTAATVGSDLGGGGVHVEGNAATNATTVIFNMYGGEIKNNNSNANGGGIYSRYATVNIHGGEISGNTCRVWGGGLSVSYSSRFTMDGGKITGNASSGSAQGGGGLAANNSAILNISGGEISGNRATNGGGVRLNAATFTVNGSPIIAGNTDFNGEMNNFGIDVNQTISVSGTLGENAYIGINLIGNYTSATFTSNNTVAANKDHFFSDNTGKCIGVATNNQLQLADHVTSEKHLTPLQDAEYHYYSICDNCDTPMVKEAHQWGEWEQVEGNLWRHTCLTETGDKKCGYTETQEFEVTGIRASAGVVTYFPGDSLKDISVKVTMRSPEGRIAELALSDEDYTVEYQNGDKNFQFGDEYATIVYVVNDQRYTARINVIVEGEPSGLYAELHYTSDEEGYEDMLDTGISLEKLREALTVTLSFAEGQSAVIDSYTLLVNGSENGQLHEGDDNTITVVFQEQSYTIYDVEAFDITRIKREKIETQINTALANAQSEISGHPTMKREKKTEVNGQLATEVNRILARLATDNDRSGFEQYLTDAENAIKEIMELELARQEHIDIVQDALEKAQDTIQKSDKLDEGDKKGYKDDLQTSADKYFDKIEKAGTVEDFKEQSDLAVEKLPMEAQRIIDRADTIKQINKIRDEAYAAIDEKKCENANTVKGQILKEIDAIKEAIRMDNSEVFDGDKYVTDAENAVNPILDLELARQTHIDLVKEALEKAQGKIDASNEVDEDQKPDYKATLETQAETYLKKIRSETATKDDFEEQSTKAQTELDAKADRIIKRAKTINEIYRLRDEAKDAIAAEGCENADDVYLLLDAAAEEVIDALLDLGDDAEFNDQKYIGDAQAALDKIVEFETARQKSLNRVYAALEEAEGMIEESDKLDESAKPGYKTQLQNKAKTYVDKIKSKTATADDFKTQAELAEEKLPKAAQRIIDSAETIDEINRLRDEAKDDIAKAGCENADEVYPLLDAAASAVIDKIMDLGDDDEFVPKTYIDDAKDAYKKIVDRETARQGALEDIRELLDGLLKASENFKNKADVQQKLTEKADSLLDDVRNDKSETFNRSQHATIASVELHKIFDPEEHRYNAITAVEAEYTRLQGVVSTDSEYSDLSNSQKSLIISKLKAIADDYVDQLLKAEERNLDKLRDDGIAALQAGLVREAAREEQKNEIDAEAETAKKTIEESRMSDKQKDAAKKAIDSAATSNKNALEAESDSTNFGEHLKNFKDDIQSVLDEAAARTEAKEEIDAAAADKKTEVNGRRDLTAERRSSVNKRVDDLMEQARQDIDNESNLNNFRKIIDDYKEELNKLLEDDLVNEKADAWKELEEEAQKRKDEVDARDDLTDEEKQQKKDEIDRELENAKDKVGKAETPEEIEEALKDAKDDIGRAADELYDEKEEAKKAVDEEAQKKKDEIDKREDLTPEEKEEAKKAVDEEAQKAKDAIDSARTPADIEAATDEGLAAVGDAADVEEAKEVGALVAILGTEAVAIAGLAAAVLILGKKKKRS